MTTESPETFRVHLEWHDSRVFFFKMKVTWGNKICCYFIFYSLYNVWKRPALQNKRVGVLWMAIRGQKVFGTFEKWAPEAMIYKTNNELFSTFCSEDPWVLLPLNNNDFFCSLLACSATMSCKGSSPLVYSHKKSVHIAGYMNVTMRKTIRMFFFQIQYFIRRNKNGFLLVYRIKLMSEMKWFSIYYKLG